MKAKLIYNLPDEIDLFMLASKGLDLAMALFEIEQYLRGVDKYDTGDDIEKIREEFYEILEKHDINLDNLVK